MFRPRVIPCLLLKNKGLVKTVKFKNPTYIGDPMNAIKIFNDLEADELVFLDITATNENRLLSLDLVERIAEEAFMPFAVGGGIKNLDEIKQILKTGAEKVIINTSSVTNPNLIREASDNFGNQSIIISIDVKKDIWKKNKVYINSGKRNTQLDPVEHAKKMEQLGAGEIIINSIDKDGTMAGYDIDLIGKVSESVQVPVVALGGAGSLNDFKEAIVNGHASAVAAGSMFVFHGPRRAVLINYPEKEDIKHFLIFNNENTC
jgi:cyclase